jgi:hypothetical protein
MLEQAVPRTHDRDCFYKYVTASTAEKILSAGCLQWSAPHLFNDPFDHQVSYRFLFSGDEAAQKLFERQMEIVFGERELELVEPTQLGTISLSFRRLNLQGEAKAKAIETFREGADECAWRLSTFQENMNGMLKEVLAHSRVLCVSEDYSNVVMWSHYAEEHRGAVIKLKCVEAVDDNLLIARPVNYTDTFPEFMSLNDWVNECFGLLKISFDKIAFDLAYIKHTDWKYEKEWRVHIPLMPDEPAGNGRSLYSKHRSVFEAIYLGCRMPKEQREKLILLVATQYPHMEVKQATMSRTSFNLEFSRLR